MMTDKEYDLSKAIMSFGSQNLTPAEKDFLADLDRLSQNQLEERLEDIINSLDTKLELLNVQEYKLTRNDVMKIHQSLKDLEHKLTILAANFASFKTVKMRRLLEIINKQARSKISRGYEIAIYFLEKGDIDYPIYVALTKKYDMIDDKIAQNLIDCLQGQFTKKEYHLLLEKYDDKGEGIGKQFIKTTMLVMALLNDSF